MMLVNVQTSNQVTRTGVTIRRVPPDVAGVSDRSDCCLLSSLPVLSSFQKLLRRSLFVKLFPRSPLVVVDHPRTGFGLLSSWRGEVKKERKRERIRSNQTKRERKKRFVSTQVAERSQNNRYL